MPDFTIAKSFDINQTYDYILSIRVSPDGFSFSVVNPNGNQLLAFQNIPIKISHEKFITRRFTEWLDTEEIPGKKFRHTVTFIYTQKFTLVPASFFVKEKSANILQSLFENTTPSVVHENYLEKINARLLFVIPKQLNQLLQTRFGNVPVLHPLQQIAAMFFPVGNENWVVLYLTPQSFCMLLFRNGRLAFANSFVVSTPADIVFFVVSVLNHERLPREETEVFLTGDKSRIANAEPVLQNHFTTIIKPDLNPDVVFPSEMQDRPDYPLIISTDKI